MAVLPRRLLRSRTLDADVFGADVASFRLHLAAGNKAERTITAYTEAVRWFAVAHLLGQTSKARWEQVDKQDVQRWMVHLLGRYSEAYAYQQYRALQQISAAADGSAIWLDTGSALARLQLGTSHATGSNASPG